MRSRSTASTTTHAGTPARAVAAGTDISSTVDFEEIDELVDHELDSFANNDPLNAGLATLNAEERQAVSLRYGAELTVSEIAKLTGERAATVESRIYRALGKLRDALA